MTLKLIDEVIDTLIAEIRLLAKSGAGKKSRDINQADLLKLKWSISKLVSDSLSISMFKRNNSVASIHLRKSRYKQNRYSPSTYRIHVERAFYGMISLGYLEVVQRGYFSMAGNRYLTRYRATDELLKLFSKNDNRILPVIMPSVNNPEIIRVQQKQDEQLSKSSKTLVDYQDTPLTKTMRKNLEFINKCLGRHWYDLEFDDQAIDQIQHEMLQEEQKINGSDRHINFSKLSLHRVFNDPAFQTGGRFYGGWWQEIPKRFRSRIVINGKRTVEYDYSNLHPTMLYLLEGLEPPSDSYVDVVPDLKGWQCPNEDNMRKAVKLCFNAMVNAPKQMTRGPKEFRRSNCNCKWSELTAAIVKRHQLIAKYFYSGAGIKLQRLDSDIAEMVMMHFANMNYPVLPIHDSFILHHGLESELQEMMERAFNRVIGGQVGVDKKKVEAFSNSPETSLFWENNTIKEQNDSEECLDYDVQELIESMNVGHHVRLTAFRALKY